MLIGSSCLKTSEREFVGKYNGWRKEDLEGGATIYIGGKEYSLGGIKIDNLEPGRKYTFTAAKYPLRRWKITDVDSAR